MTRITAGAFLTCGGKILLMKRGPHKQLSPGLWAGVGGHLDMEDIQNPRALAFIETCYREIREETGLTRADIHGLKLKYIAMRKYGDEIRLHYHFFGQLAEEIPPPACDEGEFFWVAKDDISALPMATSVKEALKHWLANPGGDAVYLVAVSPVGDSATVLEV